MAVDAYAPRRSIIAVPITYSATASALAPVGYNPACSMVSLGETDMAIKLVPGGHPYHAIGEAAGNAARDAGITAEQIDSITIHRPGMNKLHGPLHPADLIDAAHSPAYFAAAGAADCACASRVIRLAGTSAIASVRNVRRSSMWDLS